jgi:glycosyltransferase involved in cell wall biosynthesis
MKVLFFGPYPKPFTGQSISFKEVFNNYNGDKILFNTTIFEEIRFLNSMYCLLALPLIFIFNKFDRVYFTCSRSFLGFIKDFQLLLLCKLFQKKVVNHLHGNDFYEFYTKSIFLKVLINWSYSHITTSVVLFPDMRKHFLVFPRMKLLVVPNSYSLEYENIEIDFSKKARQILFLSNIMESKGIIVFLRSVEVILANYDDVIVKIAGKYMQDEFSNESEIMNKFKQIYSPLKSIYPERIFYLGSITGDLKTDVLKESSIFVLPTFYKAEAFPISIIEAMFFGNAIITTDYNYLCNIVRPKNGFLVNVNSVNDLVEKMSIILTDKERLLRIQNFNRDYAHLNYNPKLFIRRLNRVISHL